MKVKKCQENILDLDSIIDILVLSKKVFLDYPKPVV